MHELNMTDNECLPKTVKTIINIITVHCCIFLSFYNLTVQYDYMVNQDSCTLIPWSVLRERDWYREKQRASTLLHSKWPFHLHCRWGAVVVLTHVLTRKVPVLFSK
jgi:hypothetical protein